MNFSLKLKPKYDKYSLILATTLVGWNHEEVKCLKKLAKYGTFKGVHKDKITFCGSRPQLCQPNSAESCPKQLPDPEGGKMSTL